MSYWGTYEENLHGPYPEYQQYYDAMSYYNNGQEFPNYPMNPNYVYNTAAPSSEDGQLPQQQPGPSQVTIPNFIPNLTYESTTIGAHNNYSRNNIPNASGHMHEQRPSQNSYNRNNGAFRKKYGDRNQNQQQKYNTGNKNNGRRNFDKTKSNGTVVDSGNVQKTDYEPSSSSSTYNETDRNQYESNSRNKSKFNSKATDSNYPIRNFYKNNYSDRYNNYKPKDNKYNNSYENRNNYGRYKKSNKNYDDGNISHREKNNWRRNEKHQAQRKVSSSSSVDMVQKKLDAASQRERLEEMLTRRILECLVCCEKVKHTDKIWTCQQCYLILHLNCTTAWANSCKPENGWRCPACQNVYNEIPNHYVCYCGKTSEPSIVPGVLPHACGEPCMKKGRLCDHKCPILCHPGPCPDCNVMVAKPCGCGSTTQTIKCSSENDIVCDSICKKLLECQVHTCEAKCHTNACNPCKETIEQICFCGKVGRKVSCNKEYKGATQYACDDICGKLLGCGNHKCGKICHEGPCDNCLRDIDLVKTCPCGKTNLTLERTSCLDPIPCCEKICGKLLKCGQPAAPHFCKNSCHDGDCPPCPLTTLVRCRCGHMGKDISCEDVTTKADDARCEKKCTKKRLCGKHRCNQRCCIEVEHICPLPCNHFLACGQHRCDRTCHSGRCGPCLETSFEELYCECGAQVLYPPIPCGTRPPQCDQPCSRPRPCGHEVNHSCHTGPCPPCTVLCKRWCYGQHEQRSAIPCYQEDFSCGLPCGRPMPCGTHKCDKICHTGPCPLPCKQKCVIKRTLCGHPCNVPCHKPPCPETSCKATVPITCLCGLQKSTKPCIELTDEYKEIEMAQLKDKMTDLLKDQSVDITDVVSKPKRPTTFKILECTEECRVLERNRRLAIGLQIRNPDLSQKLTPRYSDYMRNWAKKDPQFCQRIHDKLTELVQLAKQSKQKSRSHSFESMNRDKRHFVHEYCEHFGCDSAAYDQEPNRNIIATAVKDKSWLPSMSLLEVIQRENGQRKVPGPVLTKSSVTRTQSETVSFKLPGRGQRPSTPPKEIDYFDNPPQ